MLFLFNPCPPCHGLASVPNQTTGDGKLKAALFPVNPHQK